MSHDILCEFTIFMHSHGQQTSLNEQFRLAKLPFPRQLTEKRKKNLQYKLFGRGWVRKIMVMTSVCTTVKLCVPVCVCVCTCVCVCMCVCVHAVK